MNNRALIFGGAAAALGVGAYVNFRLTLRREVAYQLREVYGFDAMVANNPLFKLGAQYLNVPTSAELADSLVPVFSATMPDKAIEDVLANGRKSAYWPASRRETKAPKAVDALIFAVLERLYYAQSGKEQPRLRG